MKEYLTLSALQNSTQTETDLLLTCRENLYSYIVQPSGYVATGDDVTFSNGRVGKAVEVADAKYIKTTGGNVQDDLDSIIAGNLPTQAGNQGKFLTTDGASASWQSGTIEAVSFSELEALEPENDGLAFICQERANARYILQTLGYVAQEGDVTFANGRVGELQIDGVAKGGWFESFSDAVDRGVNLDYTGETLNINLTTTTFKEVSGISIRGGVFNFTVSDTSYKRVFDMKDGASLVGGEYNFAVPVGGQVLFLGIFGDDIKVEGCKINGGVFNNEGSPSHLFYVSQPGGDYNNFDLLRNEIRSVSFVHLKPNTDTTSQSNWKAVGNDFYDIYKEGVGLNSPSGTVDGFVVKDNVFHSHAGTPLGEYGLYIAVASGNNIIIKDNEFYGTCNQCIHFEENITNSSITGNTGEVDCEQAISLGENDVGGTLEFPKYIDIHGNRFSKSGTAKQSLSAGVLLAANGTDPSPANNISIKLNFFDGFETAIKVDAFFDESNSIESNYAVDCLEGFRLTRYGAASIRLNTSKRCDVGVRSSERMCDFSSHVFDNCIANTQGRVCLSNPSFSFEGTSTVASGNVNLPLYPISGHISNGLVKIQVSSESSGNNSVKHYDVSSDGSTLTSTQLNAIQSGIIQSFIDDDGVNVNLRIFSASSVNVSPMVVFNGFISSNG